MKLNNQRSRKFILPALLLVVALLGTLIGSTSQAAMTGGTVVGWGDNEHGQVNIPTDLSDVTAIAAGSRYSLALKSDGTVVGWGLNNSGQLNIPAGLSGVMAIDAGGSHNLALKEDGTVVGWGWNVYGQASPPAGLSGVTAIAAGWYHSLALKEDGTVVGWGYNGYRQLNIPAAAQSGVTAIAAGHFHNLALKMPPPPNAEPVALSKNVTVSAGTSCTATVTANQVNNGSSDPDGDSITLSLDNYGPFGIGSHPVTLTVTDSHGASSSATATVTVVDSTNPTLTCPTNVVVYLPLNSMDTGMAVNYPAPTATDCSSVTIATSKASGSVFPVGTTTVNVTATDAAGNQSSCSFTVTVRYNFGGFQQPVDPLPAVNVANAGTSVPVKFSLSGNKGLAIFAAGSPSSQPLACGGGTPDDIEETVTTSNSGLSYDATTDTYIYVWKTDRAWKGTCRQLLMKFNDGTTQAANFQFK